MQFDIWCWLCTPPYLPITHLVTPALALCPTQSLPHLHTLSLSHRSHLFPPHYPLIMSFLHIIILSSPSTQLPVPLPSRLPIFVSSCILHLSISHSSHSSPSLTQLLSLSHPRPHQSSWKTLLHGTPQTSKALLWRLVPGVMDTTALHSKCQFCAISSLLPK